MKTPNKTTTQYQQDLLRIILASVQVLDAAARLKHLAKGMRHNAKLFKQMGRELKSMPPIVAKVVDQCQKVHTVHASYVAEIAEYLSIAVDYLKEVDKSDLK